MLRAATIARWRYDFPLAERLAGAAVGDGAGFEARLLAAQLASLQGRAEEALEEFSRLAQEAETDAEQGILAVGRIDTLAFYLGRMHEGLRLAQTVVYAGVSRGSAPSGAYQAEALKVSEGQIALAGYRLAALLNAALK